MLGFDKRAAAAAGLASLLLTATVPVQAQSYSDSRAISAFTEQNVRAVLAEVGAETSIVRDDDGSSYIRAKMKSGLIVLFAIAACGDDGNCDGLNIMAIWDRPAGWSDAKLLATLSDFESKYAFIKAGLLKDGSVYLQRYIISDFGTYMGNVRIEASTFETIALSFAKIIDP